MQDPKIAEREWAEKALSLTEESFAILFDRAPVMMHSIDRDGRLVKVNRRWLRKLGYEREEVLGQKCIDFLTEESRLRALKDTLPVFWRVGSARSIGHRFVKKTGRVLDVLLDAEVIHGTGGNSFSLAALRDSRNIIQWHQASTTIRALREVIHVQRKLESVLSEKGNDTADAGASGVQQSSGQAPEAGLAREVLGPLLERAHDISGNLRALLRVEEERLDATAEQQGELLLVAKSIDRTLVDLADTLATPGSRESSPR